MRLGQPIQFMPAPPAKLDPLNDLMAKCTGVQGAADAVLSADVSGSPDASPEPVPAVAPAPNFGSAASIKGAYFTPLAAPQPLAGLAGLGVSFDPAHLWNPGLMSLRMNGALSQLGAHQATIEASSEFAAVAAEELKKYFPATTNAVDTPIAAFALVNAGFGLSQAIERGDRNRIRHYALDGTEHALDLGADLIDLLSHSAASSGSKTLHTIAFVFRVGKLLYVLRDTVAKGEGG